MSFFTALLLIAIVLVVLGVGLLVYALKHPGSAEATDVIREVDTAEAQVTKAGQYVKKAL